MADFSNIQSGIRQAFAGGTATRTGALGSTIAKVAKGLRTQRETGEELQVFGQKERVKARIKQEFEPQDIQKDILGLISGIKGPESAFAPARGPTGGPIVPGPGGRFITGELPPGEEFQTTLGLSQADILRQELGVTQKEAQRKFLGLPKAEKKTGQITASVAINILSDPTKSRQFKREFGEEAFENLKNTATGGINKVSLLKRESPAVSIMDTNF